MSIATHRLRPLGSGREQTLEELASTARCTLRLQAAKSAWCCACVAMSISTPSSIRSVATRSLIQGQVRCIGVLMPRDRLATPATEQREYQLLGPQYYLARATFHPAVAIASDRRIPSA
jgi:hypothetical protein